MCPFLPALQRTLLRSWGCHCGNSCQSRRRVTPGHTSSLGVPSSLKMCSSCCSSLSPGKMACCTAGEEVQRQVCLLPPKPLHPSGGTCNKATLAVDWTCHHLQLRCALLPCMLPCPIPHLARQLRHDAADAPDVHRRRVVRGAQQHLWRAVPQRHNLAARQRRCKLGGWWSDMGRGTNAVLIPSNTCTC